MNDRLASLVQLGVLSSLDLHFARAVATMAGERRDEVLLAAALVSRHTRAGHVCLSIPELDPRSLTATLGESTGAKLVLPEVEAWIAVLRTSPLVGRGDAPLVLDDAGRLYLERYWRYEVQVASELRRRSTDRRERAHRPELAASLDQLFPPAPPSGSAPARAAAEAALTGRLVVITGGPGTGKTSTVLRLLALLTEERQLNGGPSLSAALLAPTGKAAARLAESIRERKLELPCSDAVKRSIPEQTSTIHRALGWRKSKPTRFIHDEDNPLAADVIVVDEASMVDLALLAKLLAATPKSASLILLGDEDQLSSVEVGAILGDICKVSSGNGGEEPAIARCIFRLERSHRFGVESGIGALARAIQSGDAKTTLEILRDPARPDVRLVESPGSGDLMRDLVEEARFHYEPYWRAQDVASRARAFSRYRVLCAHARGPGGASATNREIERRLVRAGVSSASSGSYDGRPIMIGENDYELELYNGDVGFITERTGGELRAEFVSSDGHVRSLNPARLPRHDTVFAMTIHKSQGSEMDQVSIVLPDHLSPVLSRELLYTAVTRARIGVSIHARAEVIVAAVEHRIQRASGLADAAWRDAH